MEVQLLRELVPSHVAEALGTQSTECPHRRYRCLRCANTGCEHAGCPDQAFHAGLCRSCGHIERQQLSGTLDPHRAP